MNRFRNVQRQIEPGSRTEHQGSSEPPYSLNFEIVAIERIIEEVFSLVRGKRKQTTASIEKVQRKILKIQDI